MFFNGFQRSAAESSRDQQRTAERSREAQRTAENSSRERQRIADRAREHKEQQRPVATMSRRQHTGSKRVDEKQTTTQDEEQTTAGSVSSYFLKVLTDI